MFHVKSFLGQVTVQVGEGDEAGQVPWPSKCKEQSVHRKIWKLHVQTVTVAAHTCMNANMLCKFPAMCRCSTGTASYSDMPA